MGMDGLSMANTGILKESTSADFANKTEQIMQSDPSNDSQQVQIANEMHLVKEKEGSNEHEKRNKQQQETKQEEFEDGLVKRESETSDFDIEDLENPNKDFYVKLNAKDDIIELYDSSTDRLIETISGDELLELVRKLNMASGLFINKKV